MAIVASTSSRSRPLSTVEELVGGGSGVRVATAQRQRSDFLTGYRTIESHESPPTINTRYRLSSEGIRRKYLITGFDRVFSGEVKNSALF